MESKHTPSVTDGSPDHGVGAKVGTDATLVASTVVPYDENLLGRSRLQWQFGAWESLAGMDRHALQHHPNRAKLALLAASANLQMGSAQEAMAFLRMSRDWGVDEQLVRRVLISGVHNNLARAAALRGQSGRAQQHFEYAVSIGSPGADVALLTRARREQQLRGLGINEHADGTLSYERLVQLGVSKDTVAQSPNEQASYLSRTGTELYGKGMYKLALEYYQKAFQIEPDNAWYCQNVAEAAARAEVRSGQFWESPELGQSIEQGGRWQFVVRHYWQALRLSPARVEEYREGQSFDLAPHKGDEIDDPIFVVGCGHSGTSLMLAMLGAHPDMHPIPKEVSLFMKPDLTVQEIMREWDDECRKRGKVRWVEKTPPHILQINRFLAFRPKSKFVLMLRDGRDVVCSLAVREEYRDLQGRLDRWTYDNLAGLPYWDDSRVMVVRYEDLVVDTVSVLQSVAGFLAINYDSSMLGYYKTKHYWYSDKISKTDVVRTHQDHKNNRNWQINQPVFDGRGRWQREMSDEDKAKFKESPAEKLLEQFCYASDSDW